MVRRVRRSRTRSALIRSPSLSLSPGLNLALLVQHSEGIGNLTLDVYSVHDGELLKSVDRPTGAFALLSREGEDDWAGRQIDWTWTEQPDPVQVSLGPTPFMPRLF